jgi:hypothetical protein
VAVLFVIFQTPLIFSKLWKSMYSRSARGTSGLDRRGVSHLSHSRDVVEPAPNTIPCRAKPYQPHTAEIQYDFNGLLGYSLRFTQIDILPTDSGPNSIS